jgi:hypothetical protein
MASELTAHNVVKLSVAKAARSKLNQNRACASCGRQIRRNSNYMRGNDGGVIVLLHRRCFLAEMRDCCALA